VLGCLLAAVLSAAGVEVPIAAGSARVEVALDVRTAAGTDTPALAWSTRANGAHVGTATTREWAAEVSVAPGPDGGDELTVTVRWRAPASLVHLAAELSWPGRARVVGRDLALQPLHGAVRVGRGTPVLADAGAIVLAGGRGLVGARFVPGRARGRETVRATLLLDDAADRPFETYRTCLEGIGTGDPRTPLSFGPLEHRDPMLGAVRRAGDVDAARASLWRLAPGGTFRPVIVERWPRGARAAVVFTDHADRTDPDALRAVLWGSADPEADGRPGSGFLGRGVKITKSFFVHVGRGGLDDPEIAPLARDLERAGSEVALHSITGWRDDRAAVKAGLAAAAVWRPVTWIDHEPYTNCEAISNQGWRDTGTYGIRDLLVAAGIRWVWAAGDVGRGGTRVVDVFDDADPGGAHPAVSPLPVDSRLWLFASSMFYDGPAALAAALSDAALSALERERGLFVAHTYLAASPYKTHVPDHLARLAVRPGPAGRLVLDPEIDRALGRIAARVRAGTLASLTWAEAGDRLVALGEVVVVYRPDGGAEVRNEGDAAVDGLTLAVPEEGLEVTADGVPLPHADEPGLTRVWLDLAPGARAVLRASRDLAPAPFLPQP
jgi:hypothetical protein